MPNRVQRAMPMTLGLIVTTAILVVGGFFLYQAFWPVQTFTFKAIVTDKTTYVTGDTITYTTHGCKYTSLPVTVDLEFEGVGPNHYEYPVQSFIANVRQGCGVRINQVQLPIRVTPGPYVLRSSVTTSVNPLHSVTSTAVSNVFTVTTAPPVEK